ncbi:MAG: sulfatase [Bacteroidales bacterium]
MIQRENLYPKLLASALPLTILSLSAQSSQATNSSNAQQRPNIILFMVDDQGWQDTSHPFWSEKTALNEIYRTPSMERLAAKGVTFTAAYASAVSSPTRTSLMTGMNPSAHRVTTWTREKDSPTDSRENSTLIFPEWNYNALQPIGSGINNSLEALPFTSILQSAGYKTIHCGKAHWGASGTPGSNPLNLSFDVNIAGYEAGSPASYLASENFGYDENRKATSRFIIPGLEKYWGSELFLTEILTIEAKMAIDSALTQGNPFYLYMSHYAIHTPLDKDDRFYDSYVERGLDDRQARYASLIEGMDKSLGDLMDHLEQREIAENTVIIFMSDNGGLSLRARSGVPNTHNLPLNSGKGSAYEGGVRVPMIAYMPNVSPMGERCSTPVSIIDFFPSILDIASVEVYETPQRVDGISLLPLIKNPEVRPREFDRALIWHYPNRWVDMASPKGNGYGVYSAIQKDGWKLIHYYDHNITELFNLNDDIGERLELSNSPSCREIRDRLASELTVRLKGDKAQLPIRLDGVPCLYPDGSLYVVE